MMKWKCISFFWLYSIYCFGQAEKLNLPEEEFLDFLHYLSEDSNFEQKRSFIASIDSLKEESALSVAGVDSATYQKYVWLLQHAQNNKEKIQLEKKILNFINLPHKVRLGLLHARNGLMLALQINDYQSACEFELCIAKLQHYNLNSDSAEASFKAALRWALNLKNSFYVEQSLLGLCETQVQMGKSNQAAKTCLDCMRESEKNQHFLYAAKAAFELGKLYSTVSDTINSIEFFKRASQLSKQIGNKEIFALATLKLVDLSGYRADFLQLLDMVNAIIEDSNRLKKSIIAEAWLLKAKLFEERANQTEVKQYQLLSMLAYQNAFNVWSNLDNHEGLLKTLVSFTKLLNAIGMKKEVNDLIKAAEMYGRFAQNKEQLRKLFEIAASIYAAQENYERAYEFQTKFNKVNSEILNELSAKEITRLQIEYKTQEKELQIAKQQQEIAISKLQGVEKEKALAIARVENQQKEDALNKKKLQLTEALNRQLKTEKELAETDNLRLKEKAQNEQKQRLLGFSIIGGTLLLTIAIVIFFFVQKQSKLSYDLKNLQARVAATKAQIDAHVSSNIFDTARLQMHTNVEVADDYLLRAQLFVRESLQRADALENTLEEEISFLNNYIEMEKIRLQNQFSFILNIQPEIELQKVLVPSLILQPLAENSLLHGFHGIQYPGKISLDISINNERLLISFTDNGVGIKPKENANAVRKSKGTLISQERIEAFGKLHKSHATMQINQLPQGVQVVIDIPLNTQFALTPTNNFSSHT